MFRPSFTDAERGGCEANYLFEEFWKFAIRHVDRRDVPKTIVERTVWNSLTRRHGSESYVRLGHTG